MMTAEALETLNREIRKNYNGLISLNHWKNGMKWISVRAKLPDTERNVLVSNGFMSTVNWYDPLMEVWGPSIIEATHWTELPEMPNE